MGAVDGIDDPLPASVAFRSELFAENPVIGALGLDQIADGALRGDVRVGDEGRVRLRADVEIRGVESTHRHGVGGVGETEGEGEIGSERGGGIGCRHRPIVPATPGRSRRLAFPFGAC